MVDGTAAPLGSVREMLHGIKLDECPALLRTMLAKFDKNGNGIIDPDELPIANDDGISIKAFPENVQPFLREIDEEGNGKLEMGELTEMATTYVELKKANKEGSIAIKTLPKEIQPTLKVFDVDGDGTVAPMELARGAELYKGSKKTAKRLMTFSGVLLLILCALVGVIVGLVAVVVENSKESKVDADGVLNTKGDSSKPVASASLSVSLDLYDAPDMELDELDEIKSLTIAKLDGTSLAYTVTGYETIGTSALDVTEVKFFTARGDRIIVTKTELRIVLSDDKTEILKKSAGDPSRRRELLAMGEWTVDTMLSWRTTKLGMKKKKPKLSACLDKLAEFEQAATSTPTSTLSPTTTSTTTTTTTSTTTTTPTSTTTTTTTSTTTTTTTSTTTTTTTTTTAACESCECMTVGGTLNDKGMEGCPAVNCAAPLHTAAGAGNVPENEGVREGPFTSGSSSVHAGAPVNDLFCRSCESIKPSEEPAFIELPSAGWGWGKNSEKDIQELNMGICSASGCGFDTSWGSTATTCTTCDKIEGRSIADCVRSGCGYSGSGDKCTSCWQLQGNGTYECSNKYGCSQMFVGAPTHKMRGNPRLIATTLHRKVRRNGPNQNSRTIVSANRWKVTRYHIWQGMITRGCYHAHIFTVECQVLSHYVIIARILRRREMLIVVKFMDVA